MRNVDKACWVVCLLGLGALLVSGAPARAGGKKPQEEKKQDEAKKTGGADSKFKGKALPLKWKDGKASYEGEITADDPAVNNRHYKVFTIKMEADKTYRIEQNSVDDEKFDSFLFLEDAAGKSLASDDDSGGGLNSLIVYKAPTTGTYRIIASTFPPNATGKFKLNVSVADAKDAKEAGLKARVEDYVKSTPAERKKLLEEINDIFQEKGTDLTIKDAMLAFQLTSQLEAADITLAKAIQKDYIKLFAAASDKKVASISQYFASNLKKMDIIGKEFEVAGKTVDGKDFDLKQFKGKVVLVDFWATWCGPCIAELPNIQSAYKKYHDKGFEIIGVSLDRSDEAITKFAEARKIPWACINIEDSKKLTTKYGVNAIPFPVLVDADGRVVHHNARGPALDIMLEKLLSEKK